MKQLTSLLAVFAITLFAWGIALGGELEPLFPGYPELFDSSGTVDMMPEKGDDRIVIDDSNHFITSDTTFNTEDGPTSIKSFSENDMVGVIHEEGSENMVSLWLISKGESGSVEPSGEQESSTHSGTIRLEGGVWKN